MSLITKLINFIGGNPKLKVTMEGRRRKIHSQIHRVDNDTQLNQAWDEVFAFNREYKWDYRTKAYVTEMEVMLEEKSLSLRHSKVQ